MTPELRKIVFKFKTNELRVLDKSRALKFTLVHIEEILKIPIFWVEKGSSAEAQFGQESTQEYWEKLKKEIEEIQKKNK